jgi:hypothetical protein
LALRPYQESIHEHPAVHALPSGRASGILFFVFLAALAGKLKNLFPTAARNATYEVLTLAPPLMNAHAKLCLGN